MSNLTFISDDELLARVKKSLGVSGTFQDDTLRIYIDEVKEYMKDAGVNVNIVQSTLAIGAISRGVCDLWNYGQGNTEFSRYFLQRITQLIYKEVDNGE